MARNTEAQHAAVAIQDGIGRFMRRVRQLPLAGDLSLPQRSALRWLDRCGPSTASDLARLDQISPQSMGVTIAELEARGLLARSTDPEDGRRSVLSITTEGAALLKTRHDARVEQLSAALSQHFTAEEIGQLTAAAGLIERLADNLR